MVLRRCSLQIMDGVHAVFESIIEWDAFAVRIKESAVTEQLPQVRVGQARAEEAWLRSRMGPEATCRGGEVALGGQQEQRGGGCYSYGHSERHDSLLVWQWPCLLQCLLSLAQWCQPARDLNNHTTLETPTLQHLLPLPFRVLA